MKIHRDVCKAPRDVGYVHYDGLPGAIKTGCTNTPDFASRYCEHHKDYACELKVTSYDSEEQEFQFTGPLTRAKAKAQGSNVEEESGIIERILEERQTRSRTYYKVSWGARMRDRHFFLIIMGVRTKNSFNSHKN